MPRRQSDIVRMAVGLVVGGLVLFAINLEMDPVPVAAAPAFAAGAIGFLIMRPKAHRLVINLAIVGALVGVYIHYGWHADGSSPPPPEGLFRHLVVEGFIGLFAALFALLVAGLVLRFLERR